MLVPIHTVRRRVGDRSSGGPGQVRDQPDGGRLPVGSGHRNDGDRRVEHARRGSGVDAVQPARDVSRRSDHGSTPVEEQVEQWGQLAGERFGRALPPPRKGDHHLVRLRSRPAPSRQMRAGGRGQRASQVDRKARDITAPLLAAREARMVHRRKAGPLGQLLGARFGQLQPGGHRKRQLDRRTREVKVGSVEHPQLEGFDGVSFALHHRPVSQERSLPRRRGDEPVTIPERSWA